MLQFIAAIGFGTFLTISLVVVACIAIDSGNLVNLDGGD